MGVGSRSHVTKPYYVVIKYYNPLAKDGEVKMTTCIPNRHSLDWVVGNNWDYHYNRILEVYPINSKIGLLFNQPLI